jgi:hypothetical protein
VKTIVAYTGLAVSGLFVLTFLRDKETFTSAASEGIVEELSALLSLAAAAVMASVVLQLRRRGAIPRGMLLLGAFFGFVFFLVAMEELSWLQRFLGFETPEVLKGVVESNVQNELNLHNVSSELFENLYYFGSFAFFVAIPYLNDRVGLAGRLGGYGRFLPEHLALVFAAIGVGYNYDMWNGLPTQFAFFVTLFALVSYALDHPSSRRHVDRILLVALAVTQFLFLLWGDSMLRDWDATEYKEFFIPAAFLVYALTTRGRLLSARTAIPALD